VRVGICLNFDCLQKSGNVLEMPWSDRARRSFSVNRAKKGNASWKGTRSPSELWRDRNPGIGFSSAHRTCHRLTSCFVSAEYVATLAFRSKSPGLLSSAPSGDSSDPLSPIITRLEGFFGRWPGGNRFATGLCWPNESEQVRPISSNKQSQVFYAGSRGRTIDD
jgi:hypothetical protein